MRPRCSLGLLIAFASAAVTLEAAPAPPVTVTALVNGNTVTLTWQTPTSGSLPLGYLVEASLSPGSAPVAAFLVVQPALVLNAVPNAVYYVRVRSGNAEGLSAPSHEVIVHVPGASGPCAAPPGAPTNLVAGVSGSLVNLAWLAPVGGCAPETYIVEAGSAHGLSDLAIINVGNTASLAISAPEGTYFVRVVAVNAFGASNPSTQVIVAVGAMDLDLTGRWIGTGDYINAPFEMNLRHTGRIVLGSYQDQKDPGSVGGELDGRDIVFDVRFPDTGMRMFGRVEHDDLIRGTMWVPVLGSRVFTFEMRRQ